LSYFREHLGHLSVHSVQIVSHEFALEILGRNEFIKFFYDYGRFARCDVTIEQD